MRGLVEASEQLFNAVFFLPDFGTVVVVLVLLAVCQAVAVLRMIVVAYVRSVLRVTAV